MAAFFRQIFVISDNPLSVTPWKPPILSYYFKKGLLMSIGTVVGTYSLNYGISVVVCLMGVSYYKGGLLSELLADTWFRTNNSDG